MNKVIALFSLLPAACAISSSKVLTFQEPEAAPVAEEAASVTAAPVPDLLPNLPTFAPDDLRAAITTAIKGFQDRMDKAKQEAIDAGLKPVTMGEWLRGEIPQSGGTPEVDNGVLSEKDMKTAQVEEVKTTREIIDGYQSS